MATATGGFSGWLKSLTSSSSPTLDEEAAPRPRSDTEGRIRGMKRLLGSKYEAPPPTFA